MTDSPLYNAETITIDSSDASIGMYVSRLDRPWLETPFVFQGFTVKDRTEIELLQSYCRTVYVDVPYEITGQEIVGVEFTPIAIRSG